MIGSVAGFDWDGGNWPKCGRHGVSRGEIEEVLQGTPLVLPDRYPEDTETRFDAVGRNADGRHLFDVFTIRERNGKRFIRPISARYMHRKEIASYEWQAGKGP
ncbi:MAG: BrnT family toxin [Geminicoccaceae bacterium]